MTKYRVEVDSNGTICWYKWDTQKLHREDGPALENINKGKFWYLNGELHREDGPAMEFVNGAKEWWLNGKSLTEREFLVATQQDDCDGKVVEIEGVKYKLQRV
jgi:hypothetical protein